MSSQKSIIEQQTSRPANQQSPVQKCRRAEELKISTLPQFRTSEVGRLPHLGASTPPSPSYLKRGIRGGFVTILLLYCSTALFLLFSISSLFAAEVLTPEVKIVDGDVLVSAGVLLDEKGIDDLKSGISKELTLYIDLFRVWSMWPDEFITGKKIIKTLTSDPVKGEYVATSFDGATLIKKRFRDFNSMLKWALNIRDVKIANTKELEDSEYFVRITAEARLRKLPPVIGYLLFFVPEKEFKIVKDSPKFLVRNKQ